MISGETLLIAAVVQLLIFWFSLSLRESAKAIAADAFGDPGLREQGRVSLSPMAHSDLAGSFVVPFLVSCLPPLSVFGWGKSSPVDFRRLDDDSRGSIWVFLAGPAANAMAAASSMVSLIIVIKLLGEDAGTAALSGTLGLLDQAAVSPAFPLVFMLERFARINALLAVFHLLPLPPLDGGWLIMQYIPRDWALRLVRMEPYGRSVAAGVAILGRPDLIWATFSMLVLS